MLDLTGLPALDLAIGLAFIFFLLATLAATIQEFVAAIFGLRARTLEQGLRSMLEDPKKGWKYVDAFYAHPLVKSLYRTPPPPPAPEGQHVQPGKFRRLPFRTEGPSYISPRAFALVALDTLMPAVGQETVFDKTEKLVGHLPADLRARLQPLVQHAHGDVTTLRTNLEAWFDDTMARVSGWYKRKTQVILLVIGAVMVIALNANTVAMGERMWKEDTVRSAVVAQASAATTNVTSPSSGQKRATTPAAKLNNAADNVDQVDKVGVPMGWRGAAVPRSVGSFLLTVLGWLLTILAISLGAPFWFDTLSRLSRLRSSGKPETPLPASGSGKANERILTPPQTPAVDVHLHGADGQRARATTRRAPPKGESAA
jgi:hypothetical protein